MITNDTQKNILNIEQETTFWNFIKQHQIEIPIIQRDYAQGRIGKEHLRERFVGSLKDAIINHSKMTLDFVYGYNENYAGKNRLNPLDGQQRLTTLWLLHWYIAYRANKLNENHNTLRNFTYETRVSSREFCQQLCKLTYIPYKKGEKVTDIIENQTWFLSAWKQDPTIQSMLHMLGGTDIIDKDDKEKKVIVDGFDEFFDGTSTEEFNTYWDYLTSDNCKICFYYLNIDGEKLPLSDDLYIKMNARGKQLTNFENFKADLIDYIKKESWTNDAYCTKMAAVIDNDWTNIFWLYKSSRSNIDDIFFAFLNRYFFTKLIILNSDNTDVDDSIKKGNYALFNYLYGNKGDDTSLEYADFNVYKKANILTKETFASLTKLFSNLKIILSGKDSQEKKKNFELSILPKWERKCNPCFIPKYIIDNNAIETISNITQDERAVFAAICFYLENNDYDKNSLENWMRFVWNIISNTNDADLNASIRFFARMSPHSGGILKYLSEQDVEEIENNSNKQFASEQYIEEIQKAKQIILHHSQGNVDWKNIITEAEKTLFFTGSIRFLFRGESTQVNDLSWENFETKLNNMNNFFEKKGVQDYNEIGYNSEAILLRQLISYCDNWNDLETLNGNYNSIYDNRDSTWKNNILARRKYSKPLHHILMGEGFNSKPQIDDYNDIFEKLYKSELLKYVSANMPEAYVRKYNYTDYAIYAGSWGIFLRKEKRDRMLTELFKNKNATLDLSLNSEINLGQDYDYHLFKGWDIHFSYKNQDYIWNRDNKIYITMDGNNKLKAATNEIDDVEGLISILDRSFSENK